jgi:hypothetical protein
MEIKKAVFTLIFVLTGACLSARIESIDSQKESDRFITVYVPGSSIIPTWFSRATHLRIPGMQHIKAYPPSFNGRNVAEQLVKLCPLKYNFEHYYYFGWSGIICFKEREKAAADLMRELLRIKALYIKKNGVQPKFRIITHSHGGNVLLNVAKLCKFFSSFEIEEAIILACPVQEETKHLVKSPVFKKVYALYSNYDIVQIIDPQGLYSNAKSSKLFSEATFPESNNLFQACIQLDGSNLKHMDFYLPKFMNNLPKICQAIDQFFSRKIPHQTINVVSD